MTWTVMLKFPEMLGVPPMDPSAFMVKPLGKDPLVRLHLYGAVPPLASKYAA